MQSRPPALALSSRRRVAARASLRDLVVTSWAMGLTKRRLLADDSWPTLGSSLRRSSLVHDHPQLAAGVREGDILAGKYRVERVLGVGGMGVVVAARHIDLDDHVAIKFL